MHPTSITLGNSCQSDEGKEQTVCEPEQSKVTACNDRTVSDRPAWRQLIAPVSAQLGPDLLDTCVTMMMKAIADCQHDCRKMWCDAGSRGDERSAKNTRHCTCSATQGQQQQQQGPDYSRLHPLLQRRWDHAENVHLGHIVIKPFSMKEVWWACDACPAG